MIVKADKEVLDYIRETLPKRNANAVRFKMTEICCGMGELNVVFDNKTDDDTVVELEGITFVANKELSFLIRRVELERTLLGIDIKREYN